MQMTHMLVKVGNPIKSAIKRKSMPGWQIKCEVSP